MLACLTRGNLLDVLQEGFNEVTVCSSHAQLPSPQRLPPNLWKGFSAPILRGTPDHFPRRALRGQGGGYGADEMAKGEKSEGPPASGSPERCPSLVAYLSPADRTKNSEVISFQKRWSPLFPGILPKKIPRESPACMARVLVLFQDLTGWAKLGVGWNCIGGKFERGQGD